ncbi:metal-dependent hydrolase [Persicobacter diffluens]|uniref:Membrane protein n=1 Tax=Persicobacter diffluens TaxID=981 RepID=A0AAN5AP63_9BACT|nr:membrane protein [Persicobacter diffluens]
MANFTTHSIIGASAAVAVSYHYMATEAFLPALSLGLLTYIGSIFPDVDSKNAIFTRILFRFIGVSLGLFFSFLSYNLLTPTQTFILFFGVFGFVLFILKPLFNQHTKHRGAWHSFPMALLSSFLIGGTIKWAVLHLGLFHEMVAFPLTIPLSAAFAFFTGYLVHLLLDELYSIMKIKLSLGTALTLFDPKQASLYAGLYIAALIAFFWLWEPSYTENILMLTSWGKWIWVHYEQWII